MSSNTLRPGATTQTPVRASTKAGPALASTEMNGARRSVAARLASALRVALADDTAPSSDAAPTPARPRAHHRARGGRAAGLAGASAGTRVPTTGLRTLRPRGLEWAARRRTRELWGEHQEPLCRHSAGVAALARAVGRRLGLEPVELREVIHTAELHDVGKLALPDEILDKKGPLDDEEWRLMRQHTVVGERIVAALPAVADVGPLVRSCHERWDGRGYPDGLAGEEIPLASRIVFACDAFDAMTSARPYQRRPKRGMEALGELEQCAGTQFDQRVVRALVEEVASSGGAVREEGAMVG